MKVVAWICFLRSLVAVTSSISAGHATLRKCNRGFCFTKKEEPLDPSIFHAMHLSDKKRSKLQRKRSGGIDFCSATISQVGATIDCELFHILGTESVDEEFEALECPKGMRCGVEKESGNILKPKVADSIIDEGFIELDEDLTVRKTLKERPKRGRCIENDSRYTFDCNLVEILDDGSVLIEDLREGGVFAAHPKADFTSKKKRFIERFLQKIRTPSVIMQDDPTEDFRTNIALNMEGI